MMAAPEPRSEAQTAPNPDKRTSPLRAVLDACDRGRVAVPEIAADTGLSADLVRTILEQLTRMGRVRTTELTTGCPVAGEACGTCAEADELSACAINTGQKRGAVLVELNTSALRRGQ